MSEVQNTPTSICEALEEMDIFSVYLSKELYHLPEINTVISNTSDDGIVIYKDGERLSPPLSSHTELIEFIQREINPNR